MKQGDRIVWTGALTESGQPKGGWAGNGRGIIAEYEPNRPHFRGGTRESGKDEPSFGPAVGLLLDGGDPAAKNKYDAWVDPRSGQIVPDTEPLVEHPTVSKFLKEESP